jgi:hypothetical protein
MENKLREIIRGLVKEIQSEEELEEMTGTGAVAGYNTPAAFSKPGQTAKKNKRLANVSGGTVVDDLEEGLSSSASSPFTKPSDVASKNSKLAKISGGTLVGEDIGVLDLPNIKSKPTATLSGKEDDKDGEMADVSDLHLVENRWLELKREDASPQRKISAGLSNVKKQLAEIEKFVNWYGRLKTENGVDRTSYYKRTFGNLNSIKERLNKIAEKIHSM